MNKRTKVQRKIGAAKFSANYLLKLPIIDLLILHWSACRPQNLTKSELINN